MFSRIFDWFARRRKWREDHKRTWMGLTKGDEYGITQFQRLVLSTLAAQDPDLAFKQMGKSEAYFMATIPGSEINVFIFPDGVQVVGEHNNLRAEEWDYRTPSEMIEELISVLRALGHAT